MTPRIGIALIAAASLAGCAVAQPTPVHGVTPGRTCDNGNLQQFVGQTATAQLGAEMIRVSNAAVLRWVAAGTAVTMEYRADRLTVFLDPSNRVERISCS
jgi:hypothetical protein